MISASARTSCPTTMPCSSGGTLPSCSRLLVTTTELLSFRMTTGSAWWGEKHHVREADPGYWAADNFIYLAVSPHEYCTMILISVTQCVLQTFFFYKINKDVAGLQSNKYVTCMIARKLCCILEGRYLYESCHLL